jgi:hypothetical protein
MNYESEVEPWADETLSLGIIVDICEGLMRHVGTACIKVVEHHRRCPRYPPHRTTKDPALTSALMVGRLLLRDSDVLNTHLFVLAMFGKRLLGH